jgi:hypothetical protein
MYDYDRSRTASQDSLYNAIYGVITRMLAYIQPGLQKLEGADPDLGTYSQMGHMTRVYVEGGLTVAGQTRPDLKWSITVEASAMKGDVGATIEMNGRSEYLRSGDHVKLNFGGFTDSKHMAEEIVRAAAQMRTKLSGR